LGEAGGGSKGRGRGECAGEEEEAKPRGTRIGKKWLEVGKVGKEVVGSKLG
jgi:hypothetical protein